MLLLYSQDTRSYFAVDNATGKINFVSKSAYNTLVRFKHYFGGIDILKFRDKEAVDNFRKLLKKVPLSKVPIADTKQYIMTEFPEFFI